MAGFNKAVLLGRLTADPELKQTVSGISVTSFTLAVDRRYKNGEEPQADFIPIVCWRQTAEFVSRYFRRGSPILVCGSIQVRKWTDKDGQNRYATEVVADEDVEICVCGQRPLFAVGSDVYGKLPVAFPRPLRRPLRRRAAVPLRAEGKDQAPVFIGYAAVVCRPKARAHLSVIRTDAATGVALVYSAHRSGFSSRSLAVSMLVRVVGAT